MRLTASSSNMRTYSYVLIRATVNRQCPSRGRTENHLNFDLQPTLVGKRIWLRPLRAENFDALFAAASDPLIWAQHPESDRYTREVFRRYFDTAMESGGAFAIIDRATGRIIGSTRYYNWQPDASEIEIGWTFLETAYWGGVYNRELKALMLKHAFQFV